MSPRDLKLAAINRLLDYHEEHGADLSRAINVDATPTELAKIIGRPIPPKGSNVFSYRGRTLLATVLDDRAANRFRGGA